MTFSSVNQNFNQQATSISSDRALCTICGKKDFMSSLVPLPAPPAQIMNHSQRPICYYTDLTKPYIRNNLSQKYPASTSLNEIIVVNMNSDRPFHSIFVPAADIAAGEVFLSPDHVFNKATNTIEAVPKKQDYFHAPTAIAQCWPINYELNKKLFDVFQSGKKVTFELVKNDTHITNKENPFKSFVETTSFFYNHNVFLSPRKTSDINYNQSQVKLWALDQKGGSEILFSGILNFDADPLQLGLMA